MSSPLSSSLRKTPTSSIFRRAVIKQIWSIGLGPVAYEERREVFEAYFRHVYQELCSLAGTDGSLWTHDGILKLAEELMGERSRKTPLEELPGALNTVIPITEPIAKLAVSLLLPLNISGVGGARRGAVVDWPAGQSLEVALDAVFAAIKSRTLTSSCTSCSAQVVFPRSFNAQMLEYITGFEIIWTSNLLDHLLMVDNDDKTYVYIFHQVGLLERVRYIRTPNFSLISEELILETVDSLSLLLPRYDHSVRRWFRKLEKSRTLDPGAITSKYLEFSEREIDHFHFWKERLIKLKKAFDDHEPKGPIQWWRDDRRPVQWWTFWIAAMVLFLTILFGLIQSITGILQVLNSGRN